MTIQERAEKATMTDGELVEELRALLNDVADSASYRILTLGSINAGLEAQLSRLTAENKAMREVLEPFARKSVKVPAKIYANSAETIAWVQGANDALDAVRALSHVEAKTNE